METEVPQPRILPPDPDPVLHEPLQALRHALRPLDGNEPHDEVALRLNAVECACREVADLRRRWMESLADWLGRHGDLTMGSVRWRLAVERIWKCRDPGAALDRLLCAIGGDVQGLADYLAADAIKPGAARAVLAAEDFDQLFLRVERPKAQPGKPRPIREDLRFIRPTRPRAPAGSPDARVGLAADLRDDPEALPENLGGEGA